MKSLYVSIVARVMGIIIQFWKYTRKSVNMVRLTNYLSWFMNVIVVNVNDCKMCGKTFTSAKQYQNHKGSCTMKSHNCMICHKALSHTDSLAAHVKLHFPCSKISLDQSVCCVSDRKRFTMAYFTKICSINRIND